MKKSSILIMILMVMSIQSAIAQEDENLVRNGTFEEGNIGFNSDFLYDNNGQIFYGSYYITDRYPHQAIRPYFHSKGVNPKGQLSTPWEYGNQYLGSRAVKPKGPSTGSFLAVNVGRYGKQRLWYDSITIKPNTIYSFSCILANVYSRPAGKISYLLNGYPNLGRDYYNITTKSYMTIDPGCLKLYVNGKNVSKVLNLSSYSSEWRTLSGKFTSGPDQTRIEISIRDVLFPSSANCVAVDNIVFKEIARKKKEPTSRIVAVSTDFKKISIEDIKVDQKLQLSNLYFERSKYKLLAASTPKLDELATFMKKYPTVMIRLEGHTDSQGDHKLNVALSENRAKEVRKYLVDQGIDENRIEWIGYGGQRPINSNANEFLRQKNRRVEVVILSK
jgi:outer membrane protein OmpA-like peptidoglycan-associated protein